MSWFPTFLSPWFAAAAAAIAIPALLVLYFLKLRRREMAVSSTLLWKKAIQDLQVNAPFQKLRRNLLLLLQLLLLLLLLLALSRPVTHYQPGAGKTTVVIIDRSASMAADDAEGGRTRLEEAKRRAKDLVETLGRNASAMVIASDETAEIVKPFTSDVPALKNAIDSIQQTDRKSRLKTAYTLAEAQTAFNPEQLRPGAQRPDVWVFSDGRILDAQELAIRGELKYDRIGSDKANNIGIVAMSAKRVYERPTEVQIFARLANFGPEIAKADVQLSVDGRVRTIAGTTLFPQRWSDKQRDEAERGGESVKDSVEFTLELSDAAVVTVEQMNKQGDALAADDIAQVIVPPPKPLAILLVSDGNYFLEKALISNDPKAPPAMLPSAYEAQVPNQYDVIIFDRYSPKKLPPSGNFVYFGCVGPGIKVKPVQEDGVNVLLKDVGVLDWRRDHPLLRHLSMAKIYVAEALKLEVPRESEVLVDGMKGPLIVMHREGPSSHLIVSFDLLQSNWPLRVSFPLFLHNALQYMAVGSEMDVRQSFPPGATPRLPRATVDKLPGSPRTITISGPTGTLRKEIPEAGDVVLPALDRVGVYELDPPVPPLERIAVNLLDANESNLLPVQTPPGEIGQAIAAAGGKSRMELWWWIVAFAALPMLMIEWWVYTRRVHL
jgi:hypothetical protein